MTHRDAQIKLYDILNFIKKYEGLYTYYMDIKS